MTIMSSGKRDIVTGAQLPGFIGKEISITGFVASVTPGSTSFNLQTTDNVVVPINLQNPIDEVLEGYVEVHGISRGKMIQASEYMAFSNQKFDATNYNYLCQFLQCTQNLFNVKTKST